MNRKKARERISRRVFLKGMGAGVGLGTLPALGGVESVFGGEPSGRKPNVIFIITDDQDRSMFNFLPEGRGKNLSPNIDRLASEGTILLGQHCSTPVCGPSRYSCLTGRYACRTRKPWMVARAKREGQMLVTNGTAIMPDDECLPKMLQQAGYATGAVGKNHVVHVPEWKRVRNEADPRDPEVAQELRQNAVRIREAFARCGFDYAEGIYNSNPIGIGPRELSIHNTDWITAAGLDFIDQNKDRPFFLYFATTVTHGPRSRDRSWGADPRFTPVGILEEPPDVLPPRESLPERLKAAGIQARGRENVLWLDDAVGALLRRLEQHGIADNTIIFYFTDHGIGAKASVYEGGVRSVAFVWRKGGFPCGGATDALVSNIDFAPAILDFAGGAPRPDLFDGKSMRPLLEGKAEKLHDSLYFEIGYTRGVLKDGWKYLALRYSDYANNLPLEERQALLDKENRYLTSWGRRPHNTDPMAPFSHYSLVPGGSDTEHGTIGRYPAYFDADQLYNLAEDPGEQRNLAGDPRYAAKLAEMKEELARYLADLPGGFAEFKGVDKAV